MTAGPTPGPWFVVNQGTSEEPLMSIMAALISGKPPRHEVAYCGTGDSDQEMENANARVIAAAPDLLAALKAVVSAHAEFRSQLPDNWDGDPLSDLIPGASAAIEKAEGKAP